VFVDVQDDIEQRGNVFDQVIRHCLRQRAAGDQIDGVAVVGKEDERLPRRIAAADRAKT
jgi:hypothetical protein